MKSKDFFYISLFTILFSFSLIKKNPVQSLVDLPFSLQDKPLHIGVKALSSEESQNILKNDLVAQGYKPLEVTIINSGSHTYEMSRASTSLACHTAHDIAWKQTRSTLPRSVGMKVLGLIFWPFAVASGIEGMMTYKNHRHLLNTLKAKGLKDKPESILPYSLVKRVLYVPADQFQKKFTFALEDLTGDALVVTPVEVLESG